jgi:hypothetical protein
MFDTVTVPAMQSSARIANAFDPSFSILSRCPPMGEERFVANGLEWSEELAVLDQERR